MIPLVKCRKCGEYYVEVKVPPLEICQECRSLYESGFDIWDINRKKAERKRND